jgi:hypothetical protein
LSLRFFKLFTNESLSKTLFFYTLLAFSFCVEPFHAEKVSAQKGQILVKEKACHLHLSFGSYGSGVPGAVRKRVLSALEKRKPFFKAVNVWYWGMEGEHDYCLHLNDKSDVKMLFHELKALIPAEGSRGYTILNSIGGDSHRTQWPTMP